MKKKSEIVNYIAKDTHLSKKLVKSVLDSLIRLIQINATWGESTHLWGVGRFSTVHRKERNRRNPKTGELLRIKAQYVPVFRFSNKLKKLINS